MLAERLETYKNAASHDYIANCFQVAMFFQVTKHRMIPARAHSHTKLRIPHPQ